MRFKSRYFLCELVLEDPRRRQNISQGTVLHSVKETVTRLHGDFGASAVSIALSVKYLNAYTGIILIRCRKDYHQFLWSSLPFITSLENRGQRYPCFINTLHIGVFQGIQLHGIVVLPLYKYVQRKIPDLALELPDQALCTSCFMTESFVGTIRTCQKFLIRYNRQQLNLLLKNCTSSSEREAIRKSIASCSLQNVEEPKFITEDEEMGITAFAT